jgi:hypothetical protein
MYLYLSLYLFFPYFYPNITLIFLNINFRSNVISHYSNTDTEVHRITETQIRRRLYNTEKLQNLGEMTWSNGGVMTRPISPNPGVVEAQVE